MSVYLRDDHLQRVRQAVCAGHDHGDGMVVIHGDRRLTGGLPRKDGLGLEPGYSIPLEAFERKYCIPRHGGELHDILACVQAAYYERLERDEARLVALAAKRGQYGTARLSKT